jgi:RimJ/RimL family protein N-acetyltransferase
LQLVAVPTKREHLRRIDTMEEIEWSLDHFDRDGIESYLATFARTLRVGEGGPVVAVVGIQIPKVGVAEAWALVDKGAQRHSFAFVRQLIALRELAFTELALWRMQAILRPDFEVGKNLLEVLGFSYEATLRRFLKHDLDGEMWAVVRP